MKLHLGCGEKKIKGFINVDIREDVHPDLIDDVCTLLTIKDNSIDLIYACHVLEHLGRHEYMKVLERWYNVLTKGGVLRIAVPDFEKVVNYYKKHNDMSQLMGLLYGGQTYKENYHYFIWDFNSLKKDLKLIGFKDAYKYEWRKTEHAGIDDFSQCYLPHMDKEKGTLMSLNIEAIK